MRIRGVAESGIRRPYHSQPATSSVACCVSGSSTGDRRRPILRPAAGFVGPLSAIVIGIGAGVFCYFAVAVIKPRLGYDDSLDVFGVHGIGGIWGALATGLFASTLANPDGTDGLFFGNAAQFGTQVVSVLVAVTYAFVVTFVLLKIVDRVIGLRVSKDEEILGLDISQHRESGYTILD